jgi:hypothetical protein
MTTKEIEEKTKWLKKVDLNWSEANRMMKVAEELPNYPTLSNLGSIALNLYPSSKTTTKSDNVVRFIKIAKELPNSVMSQNLGVNTLYLIASLTAK